MIYAVLKLYARLAIKIYCRKIVINKPELLNEKGPLLLACNHPNSFLDGVILTTLFNHPVYSLARGDVFKNGLVAKVLRAIKLLPIYRTSEGVENIGLNYSTFNSCQQAFKDNGIVLIFCEGACVNEWHLRPLKKGTPRLALSAWQEGIPLQVIPVALNYSSFKKFGKEIHIYFGKPLSSSSIPQENAGKQMLALNIILKQQLEQLVYEIDPGEKEKIKTLFSIHKSPSFYLLLLPAIIGFITHAILFYTCKFITELMFKKSDHYDSVITALLIISYPFYLLLFTIILSSCLGWYSLVAVLLLPLLATAAVQVKYMLDL